MNEHENENPENESGGNAEAAKWRRKLRETEAQLEEATGRVEEYQKREVESRVAEALTDPSDFWAVADPAQLRGEDGSIDPELVDVEVERVLEEKPHWAKQAARPDLHQGARADLPEPEPSFGQAIRDTLRGGR